MVLAETDGAYESCVDASIAMDDQTDFMGYSNLLTKLCTQRKTRDETRIQAQSSLRAHANKTSSEDKDVSDHDNTSDNAASDTGGEDEAEAPPENGEIRKLRKQLDQLEKRLNKVMVSTPDHGGDKHNPCGKCGNSKDHPTRRARDTKPICDFDLGGGEICGGRHLRRFCWYENPSLCNDPIKRAHIEDCLEYLKECKDCKDCNDANMAISTVSFIE